MDAARVAAALNELEAAKLRVERDARQVADQLRHKLIEQLLPVLDNLDRTIAAAQAAGDAPGIVEGARLVRAQLETVLRGYGLERIDAADRAFDPEIHDAVATLPVPIERHREVIEQLAPAYRLGTTLLRPARVVVGHCPTGH